MRLLLSLLVGRRLQGQGMFIQDVHLRNKTNEKNGSEWQEPVLPCCAVVMVRSGDW
jgi:hypothetical protein